ncbi:MAG: prolipoprotein diacylglyceryl transferase [Flavobacteriia bacterium]|nr:prolipoprotein diacylglyceryl transferase [Flavobacteriia bacterium]
MLFAINWSFDAEIIPGYRTPNWYGLLFVSGMILGYFVIRAMFKRENISNDLLDKLVMYMVPATVIGARLGHVFFYGPYWGEDGYFSHPWEIVKIWEGGLASHGAAIVILFALWYFSKKTVKKPYLWILDRIAAPIAIAGAFIRLGNLVNHEMVGYITDVPWGFRFLHHDCLNFSNGQYLCDWSEIPVRHPAQLYEAICYFISFGVLLFLYWRKDKWKQEGYIFGVFLLLIFGFRFLIEFLKEGQTARDAELMLNTGQMLSIPFVVIGILLIYRAAKRKFTSS